MRSKLVLDTMLVVLLISATPAVVATDYYVNGDTGNDDWDGLCEVWDGGTCGPKRTIQAGIDATIDGDTVWVADGTYTGPGNKNLDYNGMLITVRSQNGPENCIIDCEHDGRGFHFHSGETSEAAVDGFTITNGVAESHPWGGGIGCFGGSPMVRSCILAGNYSWANGGGVQCTNGSLKITDCLFVSNGAANHGGGVHCHESNATITNCTFTKNYAELGGGGSLHYSWCTPAVANCILWGDTLPEISGAAGYAVVSYSNVQGGWPGTGNIDADPLFVSGDDYHLLPNSPCIDSGDPTQCPVGLTDIDGEARIMGSRMDIGSDEYTDDPLDQRGDLNCDCVVDGFDIDAFVLAMEWSSLYEQQYPHCDRLLADITGDGYVDGFDIDAFVDLLLDT